MRIFIRLAGKAMDCKNCGNQTGQNYCPQCGQKTHIHRVTLGHVLHETFHAVTHTNKGILLLIKELAYRPGLVAKEYLEGKRTRYFNPLSFLVIISAASAIITYRTGYYAALSQGPTNYQMPELQRQAFDIMVQNGRLLSLVLIVPVRSVFTWLFFRKRGYNLAENLVLNALIAGEMQLLIIFFSVPLFLLLPQHVSLNNWIFQGIMVLYMAVAFRQFFKVSWVHGLLKAVLIQFLFIVAYWVLIMAFVVLRHFLAGLAG